MWFLGTLEILGIENDGTRGAVDWTKKEFGGNNNYWEDIFGIKNMKNIIKWKCINFGFMALPSISIMLLVFCMNWPKANSPDIHANLDCPNRLCSFVMLEWTKMGQNSWRKHIDVVGWLDWTIYGERQPTKINSSFYQ